MPWNPGVSYRGDEYTANAITGLGNVLSEDLVKTLQKIDEEKKQRAFNDAIVGHLAQNPGPNGQPYVPADMLLKYEKANNAGKTGIANAALANATFDAQRQATELQRQNIQSEIGLRTAQAQKAMSDGSEATTIDPVIDPTNKQNVPGLGVVRKTGAVVSTAADSGQVQLDPTGKFFFDAKSRSWKPLPAATMVLPGMAGAGAAAPGGAATFNPGAASATAGKVKVTAPDGKTAGLIPAERLQDYLAAGYTQG